MTKFISVLMLVLAILNAVSITPASAAKKKKSVKTVQTQQKSNKPRNLLTEYYSALKRMDSAKAISLINEGINLEDATDATFKALWAKTTSSSSKSYAETLSTLYSDGISLLQSVSTGMMKGFDSLFSKSGGAGRVSASDVNKFSAILSALKDKGARFKAASFYSVIFSPQMPANLFEAIINVTGQTVFTGDELGFLIVDMDVKSAVNAGISKLEVLVKRGAKIDRSNSSDGIVAKVIDNVLPY